MNAKTQGCCYLLHFDRPYKHARHYLGWTTDLPARLDEHLNGTGSRLLEVITAEGMTLADERKLKQRHNVDLCPLCNGR